MKNWVKDGLVGFGIIAIYSTFLGILNWIAGGITQISIKSGDIILVLLNILSPGSNSDANAMLLAYVFIWILTPIFWFFVGSLIGLIIRKLKKKKSFP